MIERNKRGGEGWDKGFFLFDEVLRWEEHFSVHMVGEGMIEVVAVAWQVWLGLSFLERGW